MKTITKILTTIVITLTTAGIANAANVVPKDNYTTTKLCLTASKGNTFKMNKAIMDTNLSKSFIVENVQCNNLDIVNFVEEYGTNVVKMNNLLTGGEYQGSVTVTDHASL